MLININAIFLFVHRFLPWHETSYLMGCDWLWLPHVVDWQPVQCAPCLSWHIPTHPVTIKIVFQEERIPDNANVSTAGRCFVGAGSCHLPIFRAQSFFFVLYLFHLNWLVKPLKSKYLNYMRSLTGQHSNITAKEHWKCDYRGMQTCKTSDIKCDVLYIIFSNILFVEKLNKIHTNSFYSDHASRVTNAR